jgi:PAS domain S-box-containing protein
MPSPLSQLLFDPSEGRHHLDWKAFSRAMLNATRNGVFAVDGDGTVVLSNLIIQKAFGLFPGTSLPATLPGFWPEVENTLRDHTYRSEIPIQGETGSFLARVSPIYWKSAPVGVLCVFDDRTELENATRRMHSYRELSRELDAIIDYSNDGLWICDGAGNVLQINPASERLNDIRSADVVGRNMQELVDEGFIDRSVTLETIRTGKVANLLQVNRAGRKLMLTGNPVFDDDGVLDRVVVNERDITEIDALRRELEEQSAIRDGFRDHIMELQLTELESNRIISRSPCMTQALRMALKVSGVDSTVLILGESGTGKGMVADLIHKHSSRTDRPMIKINCGAIPESLVESELFGYEKGAFTGAGKGGKPGYFELADGGILFLDEIAELPLPSQVKLLRFLEDGEVARVGGTKGRRVDVRILAATNRNLEAMVEAGEFRRDLYYRLNVIPLRMPPLRDRRECLLPLIHHFLAHFAEKLVLGGPPRLTRQASDALMAYGYPGNVRELMNICERLVVMTEGGRIDMSDLPGDVAGPAGATSFCPTPPDRPMPLAEILASVERETIADAMARYGTQQEAAIALGVNQSTIARKLKKYALPD